MDYNSDNRFAIKTVILVSYKLLFFQNCGNTYKLSGPAQLKIWCVHRGCLPWLQPLTHTNSQEVKGHLWQLDVIDNIVLVSPI